MLPRIRVKGATIVSMDPTLGIIDWATYSLTVARSLRSAETSGVGPLSRSTAVA